MATSYDVIYNCFLGKVHDSDLVSISSPSIREMILRNLLSASNAKFARLSAIDLSSYDDTLGQYNNDLGYEEIDILAEGMVWAWYNTKVNNSDLLRNFLNTSDYSMSAAPSNMLKEVRNTRDEAWASFRNAMYLYSYEHGNIATLSP